MNYETLKLFCGAIATIGLYSVLYRETKFYRFFEHMFLGLAGGYMIVAIVKETLKTSWWDKMLGKVPEASSSGVPAHWAYILLLPVGLMGYMVFSKKHNWMSRVPIGMILGFWGGQQVQIWWNRWGPQIHDSMKPLFPTTGEFSRPMLAGMSAEQQATVNNNLYISQIIGNWVFVITVLCVLSYFFFSFDIKNRFLKGMNTTGRWLVMIGLGAIFGSTVMARFALVIDRMSFIWIEFVKQGLFGR